MLDYFHNSNATQQLTAVYTLVVPTAFPSIVTGVSLTLTVWLVCFLQCYDLLYCMFAAQEMAAGWTANSGSRWPKVTAAFRRMAKSLEGAFGDVP